MLSTFHFSLNNFGFLKNNSYSSSISLFIGVSTTSFLFSKQDKSVFYLKTIQIPSFSAFIF